eukprot:Gregarina_sp_Pseudo_9__261@NODE_1167_length_1816_cov_53_563309_g1093_i0_p2_GENE_NODE_1167_length_1816_cov_53_563309_g1093_i0NODE_1167_length_1816_cov_53_563309_g1093_i0_p2_ORF_typecomplete_len254_score28_02_NODE_1167_length_1816_cov_53_563309_g1093_i0205966
MPRNLILAATTVSAVFGWGELVGYFPVCSSGIADQARHDLAQARHCRDQCRAHCSGLEPRDEAGIRACLLPHATAGCSYLIGEIRRLRLNESLTDIPSCSKFTGNYLPLRFRDESESDPLLSLELRLPPSLVEPTLEAWGGEPLSTIDVNDCSFRVNELESADRSVGLHLDKITWQRYVQFLIPDIALRQIVYNKHTNTYSHFPFLYIKFSQPVDAFKTVQIEEEDPAEMRRFSQPSKRLTVDREQLLLTTLL